MPMYINLHIQSVSMGVLKSQLTVRNFSKKQSISLFFLFRPQMLEKSLLRFAEENFSDKYCASLHGETKRIRPLALIVKRHRSMFKRPFGKHELVILEGLEKYVEGEGGEEFCKALNKIIAEEGLVMEPKLSLGKR